MRPATSPNYKSAALPPWRTAALLSAITAVFGVINLLAILPGTGNSTYAVRKLFEMDFEQSIPTWYTVILEFIVVMLLAFVTWRRTVEKGPYARHWYFLTLIFLAISIDEITGVHERLSNFRDVLGNANGFFFMAWVIPGLVFSAVFALAYVRFTLHLPRPVRTMFAFSLAFFAFGALGMEMISTNQLVSTGVAVVDRTYILLTIIEELIEMNGVILLIGTLLVYIQQSFDLRISFRAEMPPVAAEDAAGESASTAIPPVEGTD